MLALGEARMTFHEKTLRTKDYMRPRVEIFDKVKVHPRSR